MKSLSVLFDSSTKFYETDNLYQPWAENSFA